MGSTSVSGTGCAAPTRGSASSGPLAARLTAGLIALALTGGAAPISRLEVDVANLRSAKGMLRICLTADPANFPSCVDDARALSRSVPASDAALAFQGLPRGDYALAVIHDENSNAKLDTFAGIPREGFGFSRNPPILFGAPRFTAARFTLASDASVQQVRMRYLF